MIIESMANGKIDTNGQPLTNDNNNNKTMGFTEPWLIGMIASICTVGLAILGTFLILK